MIDSKGWVRRGVITMWWRVSKIGVADPFADATGARDGRRVGHPCARTLRQDRRAADRRAGPGAGAPAGGAGGGGPPPVGIAPRISDAELVTWCVMQALLSFTSEARWLRHADAHLRHLFPYLPQQPGYKQ